MSQALEQLSTSLNTSFAAETTMSRVISKVCFQESVVAEAGLREVQNTDGFTANAGMVFILEDIRREVQASMLHLPHMGR